MRIYEKNAKKSTNSDGRAKISRMQVFHGSADSVVKVKRSRDMVAAIRAAGGTKISYTEYPGVNHNSWTATYADHDNLRWLFSQSR